MALASLLQVGVAQAQVNITVTATGNPAADGAALLNATNAVYNAGLGGTITVSAGTYLITNSIVMNSNMTVNGAGDGANGTPTTLIQLPSSPNGIAAFTSFGGANMTVKNLIMDGGIPKGAFLVCCGGGGNPYQSTGVNMYSTNSAEVNVYLTNLEIRNFKLGLFLGTVNGLYVTNVTMHDNNPGGFAHNAYFVACDNVNISHSHFDKALVGDGLHIDFGGANTVVTKSTFSNNNGYGILSQQNVNVNISGTRFDYNSNDGIQVDAAGLFLLTNSWSYNSGYGYNIPDTLDGNGHVNGYWGYGDGGDIGYFYEASIANLTGDLSYPPGPSNLYEAEQADGVLGPVDTADWTTSLTGFSGTGAVDFNTNHIAAPGSLTFSHVGATNSCPANTSTSSTVNGCALTFRYSNGSSAAQTMSLTINGVAQSPISFPTTGGYSTWSTATVNAALNQGNNVVQIGVQGTSAPEIDYLQVAVPSSFPTSGPSAPTGLTATAPTPNTVNLSWVPVPAASGYNVYQNGRIIADNISGNTYTDTRILFGYSSISYNVQAVNQYGASGYSAAAAVQTPIDSPAGFQLSSGNGAGNYFNWMSANGASYYNLKRSATSGGPYATVATITNTTNLTSGNFEQYGQDATATPGTTYYYVVTAVDPKGNESATHTYEIAATAPFPSFTITPAVSSFSLGWGQSASTTIAISPTHGFNGTVSLAVSGLPAGVTATIGTPTGNTYPLTITASTSAALGNVNLTISGSSGTITATATIALSVATQVITFNPIPPQVVGTSLTVSATASSGLSVSFSVVPNGNCSVSGNVVTFLNTGNCGVLANQAGGGIYAAAAQVGQVVVVNGSPSNQTITFPTITAQTVGTTLNLVATATSALPVSFAATATTPTVCTVSGTTASFLAVGTCTITASQAGNGSYNAATPVSQSFTVNSNLQAQTITFANPGTQTVSTTVNLSASATSTLTVSFASTTQSVCTVTGTTASFVAAGTCTITASQAGNGTYAAATSVPQSFTVALASQTITFNPIQAQTVGTTISVSATASSGLPVTFAVVQNGNCTISGNAVTFTNTGNCGVIANQAGNSTYAAAPQVGQIVVVNNPSSQTISFPAIGTQTVGTPLTLSATATSGLTVSFASGTTGVCAVSGTTATFVTGGTCTITASQSGNGTYSAATPISQSFTVKSNVQSQSITFAAIATQTVGTPLALSASSTSGLTVTLTSSTPAVCTVAGTTATFLTSGSCTIVASQAGNANYSAASNVSQTFNVNAAAQTITFPTITTQNAGTTLSLSASASSGQAVAFASSTPNVCTVAGNTASLIAAGNCTITASQAGNASYSAAANVTQTFAVNLQSQTITFNPIPAQTLGTSLMVSATASSGLPVTFSLVPNGNCTVSGNTVTFVNTGNCGVLANQAGNSVYAAAAQVGQIVVVNPKSAQTITFATPATQTVGTPLSLFATASSGLTVSFVSSTTGVCTISGTTATFLTGGTCTITASQAGNSTYSAATSVSRSFTVNATLQSQTITFNAIPAQTVGTSITISATASSGLPVTFSVVQNGNCTVSGNVVTFTNTGNCGIIANQAGNSSYSAAPAVGQVVAVNNPSSQTITFATPATQTVGTPLALSATASSGLAVSFASSTQSVCTVSGTTATFLAAGTCTITASQAGNGTYAAAASVSRSFTINPGTGFTLSIASSTFTVARSNGSTDAVTVTATGGFSGTITFAESGVPSGVNYAFSPASSTSGTQFVIYVPAGATTGSYPITLTGTSGSLKATTTLTLIVK